MKSKLTLLRYFALQFHSIEKMSVYSFIARSIYLEMCSEIEQSRCYVCFNRKRKCHRYLMYVCRCFLCNDFEFRFRVWKGGVINSFEQLWVPLQKKCTLKCRSFCKSISWDSSKLHFWWNCQQYSHSFVRILIRFFYLFWLDRQSREIKYNCPLSMYRNNRDIGIILFVIKVLHIK